MSLPVWEEIIIIGVLLDTPTDVWLETSRFSFGRWGSPTKIWGLQRKYWVSNENLEVSNKNLEVSNEILGVSNENLI